MGAPLFYLQIVSADSPHPVAVIPGGGALEVEIIDSCVRAILNKGVRFRSQAHVEQDIRAGIAEAFLGLKDQTRFLVT